MANDAIIAVYSFGPLIIAFLLWRLKIVPYHRREALANTAMCIIMVVCGIAAFRLMTRN